MSTSRLLPVALAILVSISGLAASSAALEPVLVKDLYQGASDSTPCEFVQLGGMQIFSAYDSRGRELWRTDGTYLGTQRIKDIWPSGFSSSNPQKFTVFTSGVLGEIALFTANDGTNGTELWRTDGTSGGTSMVINLSPGNGNSNPTDLVVVPSEGRVYFKAFNGTSSHLYRTDGVTTTMVTTLQLSGNQVVAHLPGYIFVSALDTGTSQIELFRIDLSDQSSQVVLDLSATDGSGPSTLTTVGSSIYMQAYTPAAGREPYVTNGSIGNLVALGDLKSGTQSSFPGYFTPFGGAVYFTSGAGLVKTNGTPGGTSVVATSGFSAGGPLVDTGSLLYFNLFDVALGTEPWVTNGTTYTNVENINPAGGSSVTPPWEAANIGGTFVFQADDGVHGKEPWFSTDGTAANTDLLADMEPNATSSNAECFRGFASYGLMGAEQTPFGHELFALVETPEDFGDAPDSYDTALAENGPRHAIGGLYLGSTVDAELDRPYDLGAIADDSEGFDDEDGVAFGLTIGSAGFLGVGDVATVDVTSSGVGVLDAWVDLNQDGDFADPGEKVIFVGGGAVVAGLNAMTFTVPGSATAGGSYARFRLSSAGVAGWTGAAPDGEVEDYRVQIGDLDFGDAPDPTYPTLRASDGARHGLVQGPILGSSIDAESDGSPSSGATGDDLAGSDDEDGVTLPPLAPGQTVDVAVQVTDWSGPGEGGGNPGVLNAWIDFNRDGDWDDPDEQVFVNQSVSFGSNMLQIDVPAGASLGTTVTRFRLSNTSGLGTTGAASDGEVEDHQALIGSVEADLQITKTDGQTTAAPGGQVTYTIVASNPSGPENVFAARVVDSFPVEITGCSIGCEAAGGANCVAEESLDRAAPLGGPVIDQEVDLPVGGSVTFTATCDIDIDATGTLSNTATVSVPAGMTDPTPGNNSATDDDTLVPEGDLSISKSDGVGFVVPPASLTYLIVVENSGPSDAVDVQIDDTLPVGLDNVTWTCVGSDGGSCVGAGSGDISELVDLPSGAAVTFTVDADVVATPPTVIENTATVTAPVGFTDPVPGNDSATDQTEVLESTDVIFSDGFESGDISVWSSSTAPPTMPLGRPVGELDVAVELDRKAVERTGEPLALVLSGISRAGFQLFRLEVESRHGRYRLVASLLDSGGSWVTARSEWIDRVPTGLVLGWRGGTHGSELGALYVLDAEGLVVAVEGVETTGDRLAGISTHRARGRVLVRAIDHPDWDAAPR